MQPKQHIWEEIENPLTFDFNPLSHWARMCLIVMTLRGTGSCLKT